MSEWNILRRRYFRDADALLSCDWGVKEKATEERREGCTSTDERLGAGGEEKTRGRGNRNTARERDQSRSRGGGGGGGGGAGEGGTRRPTPLTRIEEVGARVDAGIVHFSTHRLGETRSGGQKETRPEQRETDTWGRSAYTSTGRSGYRADWSPRAAPRSASGSTRSASWRCRSVGGQPYRRVLTSGTCSTRPGATMHKSWGNAIELHEALDAWAPM